MRSLMLVLAVVWITAVAVAAEPRPDLMPEYYDTLDEAGLAGLILSERASRAYEFGGVIVQTTNRKYRISRPETDWKGDAVRIDAKDRLDFAGYFQVGDFHTHPCLPYSHYPRFFSDADVRMNDHWGTVGYMGDLCSGVARRFVPGVTVEDKCWAVDDDDEDSQIVFIIVAGTPPPKKEKACGSSGEDLAQLEAAWVPVVMEIPGPKTRARGILAW